MKITMKKMEAVTSEASPAGGIDEKALSNEPPTSRDFTVDEEIDSEEANMFGDLDDELFLNKVKDTEDEAPQRSAPEPEATPASTPPAAAAPVEQAAPAPAQTPAEPTYQAPTAVPPQQEAPSVPEQPAAQPATPGPTREEMRAQAQAELEKRYALSKEDADAMISEPETVLPKLASQMYLDIFDNVMRDVQMYLPHAVQQINSYSQTAQKDEADFFTTWPDLKGHTDEVMKIGQMYRRMYPQASKEQFIQEVGLQSMIRLKLPIQGQPGVQPAAPPQRSAPYVPPQGGSAVAPPSAPPAPNMFGDLMDEWDELERN